MGPALLLFGGFLPLLLYADTIRRRVQCTKCGYIFRQPSLPRTSLSALATAILGIVFVFGTVIVLLIAVPEIADLLPSSPTLRAIE